MNTNEILKSAAAKRTTDELFAACEALEAKGTLSLSGDERMVRAAMSDVIEQRHNLTDAMDEIYMDDDFAGTYTDALRIAYRASN